MKHSRLRTFLIGFTAGVVYALLALWMFTLNHRSISMGYIYAVPIVLGSIPVLVSSKEGLSSYIDFIIMPWLVVLTFFVICFAFRLDGAICLTIIFGPFVLIGSLAAFAVRWQRLKSKGKSTPLYLTLLLPLLVLAVESLVTVTDFLGYVQTAVEIHANRSVIWRNVKNVRNIRPAEVPAKFIHVMGIPKPLDGRLDKDSVGGVRSIRWEKGIRFREKIKTWQEGRAFTYDIELDSASVPSAVLDQHVMIGGEFFDVTDGGYNIDSLAPDRFRVTLDCRYRVTTSLNGYSSLWARFVLGQFNETILQVIKNRCEQTSPSAKIVSVAPGPSLPPVQ